MVCFDCWCEDEEEKIVPDTKVNGNWVTASQQMSIAETSSVLF
jgi:hypothetical protein